MKQTIFAVVILLFASPSFSQKIYFTDTTNVWHIKNNEILSSPILWISYADYYYTGTATLSGLQYSKMGGSYVREDTIARKVYIKQGVDSPEKVWYDYNLTYGDSVTATMLGVTITWKVSRIDSVEINGIWYKVWHFQNADYSEDHYVVEGIGCVSGWSFPSIFPMSIGDSWQQTMCFQNNGVTSPLSKNIPNYSMPPYGAQYFNNVSSCVALVLDNVSTKNTACTVAPNPITEASKILLPYTISSGYLVISNAMGQTMLNMPFQNKNELLIGDKVSKPGIYIYRVTDNESRNIYAGKVISSK